MSLHERFLRSLAAISFLALSGCRSGGAQPPTPESLLVSPSSRLEGEKVVIQPSGHTFRLPEEWLTEYAERGNLSLSRSQLDEARDGGGEWDTEFAAVVNAVIPFDRCAAHVGQEAFGEWGRRYNDLQVRVYVGTAAPEEVRARVSGAGRAAAGSFFSPVSVKLWKDGRWTTTSLTWRAWYGDYGGSAVVDFYATDLGGWNVVVVLMYTLARNLDLEKTLMLDSVH